MPQLVGKPHAKVGEFGGDCNNRLGAVPDACAECRQVSRWMERTVSWTSATASRFRSIVETILRSHDEILKSLCGFCAQQSDAATDCNCITQQYIAIGLPLTVDHTPLTACPLIFRDEITLVTECYVDCLPACSNDCFNLVGAPSGVTTCWLRECASLCAPCERITLDPCNDPDHMDIVSRLYRTTQQNLNRVGKGADILAALATLFPGSTPSIIRVDYGRVYVTIGRALTVVEQSFLKILLARVPRGFNVEIELLYPCI